MFVKRLLASSSTPPKMNAALIGVVGSGTGRPLNLRRGLWPSTVPKAMRTKEKANLVNEVPTIASSAASMSVPLISKIHASIASTKLSKLLSILRSKIIAKNNAVNRRKSALMV